MGPHAGGGQGIGAHAIGAGLHLVMGPAYPPICIGIGQPWGGHIDGPPIAAAERFPFPAT